MSRFGWLWLILSVFVVLAVVDAVVVDDEVWFDEAFSLQTVQILNSGQSIDWANYDVHTGLYYSILAGWMRLNPGLVEYVWARLLSVVFMSVFLVFAYRLMLLLFGVRRAVMIGLILAVSSTYVHYGNEVRAYALALMLSAIIIFYVVKHSVDGGLKWYESLVLLGAIFLIPWAHYWYAMVPVFMLVGYAFLGSVRGRAVPILVCSIVLVASLGFVVPIALSQASRGSGMWFQPPTLSSFPSSIMFTLMFVEGSFTSVWMFLPFLVFSALIVWGFWYALRLWEFRKDAVEWWKRWFIVSALAPFFGLLLPKLLLSGGFQNIYHHRLFLGVTWLFAIVVLYLVLERWSFLFPVFLVGALLMTGLYVSSEHVELKRMVANTPCVGGVVVVHESPFSALPYEVYGRTMGCGWDNVVSTNLTVEQGRTAGFDTLRPEQIYYDLGVPERPWLYVRSARTVTEDGYVVYQDDGVELVYVE